VFRAWRKKQHTATRLPLTAAVTDTVPLVDFSPTLRLALLALLVALLPLSWVWLRQRGRDTGARIAALTAVTMFLTFDRLRLLHPSDGFGSGLP
jgi:hypothetical protein